jgi:hypothetical protein
MREQFVVSLSSNINLLRMAYEEHEQRHKYARRELNNVQQAKAKGRAKMQNSRERESTSAAKAGRYSPRPEFWGC